MLSYDEFKLKLCDLTCKKLNELIEYCYGDIKEAYYKQKIEQEITETNRRDFKKSYDSFKNDKELESYLNWYSEVACKNYARRDLYEIMASIEPNSWDNFPGINGFLSFEKVFFYTSKGYSVAFQKCKTFNLIVKKMSATRKKHYESSRYSPIGAFSVEIKGDKPPIKMPRIPGINLSTKEYDFRDADGQYIEKYVYLLVNGQ